MKFFITLAALCLCLSVSAQTHYSHQTNNVGTLMNVTPTTSAFWRSLLKTESESIFLNSLQITNDQNGNLYFFGTNNPSNPYGTNLVGRFVISFNSNIYGIGVSYFTNADGTIVVTLTSTLTNNPSAAIRDGYIFAPQPNSTIATNYFLLDFGKTNLLAQPLIYASAIATNDVVFTGTTNLLQWGVLSANVVASGANRTIYVPQWPHFITNGWFSSNGFYGIVLTNGNEFRLTVQSNLTLSTTWATFGQ